MFKVIHKRKTKHDVRFEMQQIRTDRKREILLLICMVSGLILGIICMKGSYVWSEKLYTLWNNYLYVKEHQTTISVYFTMLCLHFLPLIGIYMIGLCAVGTPFLYLIPIGYGFVYGMLGAYMYADHMLKGIGYCALILYPGAALMGAVLIYACSMSIAISVKLLKSLSPKGQAEMANLRSYSFNYLMLLVFAGAVSVLDVAMYRMFSAFFQLS